MTSAATTAAGSASAPISEAVSISSALEPAPALESATDPERAALDITAYPHIFDAILAFCPAHYDTLKALRSTCHAARNAIEANLARHITVKSTSTKEGKFLHIRSASGVPIPGVRARDYLALAQARESAIPPARPKRPGPSLEPSSPADVTPEQALATIARVLAHTRVLDVGGFVGGDVAVQLAPWLKLDVVRLPTYRMAGANYNNTTLNAHTVVLSPSCAGAHRSTYVLVVPPGTRRFVTHEFTDLAPDTWATVSCGCRGGSPQPGYACQTLEELVIAFVQRRPAKGTSDMEFGYTPDRIAALRRTFPNARFVLVGAEGSRLGKNPPAQRPFGESNEEIKRLILESGNAAKLGDFECFKLTEWRKVIGEKRWALEMGLGDTQVLNRAEGGWSE
ncbi:hypothetical protein CspHIS471_0311350 [Cutaneotrichosporon sp. HIS471]|nr:hypothetical protein CspHIS471_0311350 [Cutaneotrichosporon sp. HIS471]